MLNQEYNYQSESMPRYLYLLFGLILIVIGFGVWKTVGWRKDTPNKVMGAQTTAQLPISFVAIPQPKADIADPKIAARSAILIDNDSKAILYTLKHKDRVPIASLTKIMTALVVLDDNRLDEVVTITAADRDIVGYKIGLVTGEQIKVSELLKSLLITSSNESALALARFVAGTPEAFVAKMNLKAQELGLVSTHYGDPHGLSAESLSTPFDQAALISYAINYPKFREIISTPQATITSVDGSRSHELKNSNRLITDEMKYEGAIGGKTGYTMEAGHCLTTIAQRDGHTLIAVVLSTFSSAKEASAIENAKLLNWGFASYTWSPVKLAPSEPATSL